MKKFCPLGREEECPRLATWMEASSWEGLTDVTQCQADLGSGGGVPVLALPRYLSNLQSVRAHSLPVGITAIDDAPKVCVLGT